MITWDDLHKAFEDTKYGCWSYSRRYLPELNKVSDFPFLHFNKPMNPEMLLVDDKIIQDLQGEKK